MTATLSNRTLGTAAAHLKGSVDLVRPVKPSSFNGFRVTPQAQPQDTVDTFERGEWVTQAVCRQGDPDALFVRGAEQRKAAAICRNCPVLMECRADALDNKVEFGVWGGLTERERRALLNRRPRVTSWRQLFELSRDTARTG